MSEPTPQSVLEKFEFYFLGLTFTLLGASIQTADFALSPTISIIVELSGWLLLTVSGTTGLSKVQWITSILLAKSKKENFESVSRDLIVTQKQEHPTVLDGTSGNTVPIEQMISAANGKAEQYAEIVRGFGRTHEIKHHIQWYSFVVGLLAVGIARGYAALC